MTEAAAELSPSSVRRALKAVVRYGAIETVLAVHEEDLAPLFRLDCLTGATALERATALVELMRDAYGDTYGDQATEAAGVLLGLDPDTRGIQSSAGRRARAAEAYSEDFANPMTAQTFLRRHENYVLDVFASTLLRHCQLRLERRTEREAPRASPADVNWVDRFDRYYQTWTPVYGLRADLSAVLQTRSEDDTEHETLSGYVDSSLYWYARVERSTHRFVLSQYGGQWILPSAEDEIRLASALGEIWHTSPFLESDDSWLILAVTRSPDYLANGFLETIDSTERGRRLFAIWQDWLSSCQCQRDGEPVSECKVHRMSGACYDFVTLLDENWYRVADWYHDLPLDLHGPDLATLRQRFDERRERARLEAIHRRGSRDV